MMKAIRRLNPLLNLHRLRRRVLKQLLAALRVQQTELSERLQELGDEWMRVRHWNAAALSREASASQVRLTETWIHGAELQAEDLKRRMSDLGLQVQEAEKRLVKASQELKMLATLQERRLTRAKAEQARRDQVDLDEMASLRTGARS